MVGKRWEVHIDDTPLTCTEMLQMVCNIKQARTRGSSPTHTTASHNKTLGGVYIMVSSKLAHTVRIFKKIRPAVAGQNIHPSLT
jgi:hypothetical protein